MFMKCAMVPTPAWVSPKPVAHPAWRAPSAHTQIRPRGSAPDGRWRGRARSPVPLVVVLVDVDELPAEPDVRAEFDGARAGSSGSQARLLVAHAPTGTRLRRPVVGVGVAEVRLVPARRSGARQGSAPRLLRSCRPALALTGWPGSARRGNLPVQLHGPRVDSAAARMGGAAGVPLHQDGPQPLPGEEDRRRQGRPDLRRRPRTWVCSSVIMDRR